MAVDEFQRGRFASPKLVDGQVHRTQSAGARSVHRFLRHLHDAGVAVAPVPIDIREDGTEVLEYLPGESAYPPFAAEVRSDEALIGLAKAIRSVHDASQSFEIRSDDVWHSMETVGPSRIDCIGHGDLAPWNVVLQGAEVVGLIDWDTARPMSRVWDLAYAAYHFVPLHPLADLPNWGWAERPDVAGRLDMFLECYGTGISTAEILTTAVMRLMAMSQHIDAQVKAGNPLFAVHAEENHAQGYQYAASDLLKRIVSDAL